MSHIALTAPSGKTTESPDANEIRRLVLELPDDYWRTGSGAMSITRRDGDSKVVLIVTPMLTARPIPITVSLKQIVRSAAGTETWLSLGDRSRLTEVVDPGNEWLISAGLFVDREVASAAVAEFIEHGTRGGGVEWIRPSEIPAGGNW